MDVNEWMWMVSHWVIYLERYDNLLGMPKGMESRDLLRVADEFHTFGDPRG